MATVRVRIAILTVRITLYVCPFNRMAHTANNRYRIRASLRFALLLDRGLSGSGTVTSRPPFCAFLRIWLISDELFSTMVKLFR
jgi:hypothetical protein